MGATKQIQSIHRAGCCCSCWPGGVNRLEDIFPRAGLSRSTAHRLLKSLAAAGLALQDPLTRHYHLGPAILSLAANPLCTHQLLVICADNELRRLQALTGETALLLVPAGLQRLVLAVVPSPQRISFLLEVGYRSPIYDGSAGLVLLSQYAPKILATILDNIELEPLDFSTITDRQVLRQELEKIRHRGFATFTGRLKDECAAVSVPVNGYVCPVALCLIGPSFRFEPLTALDQMQVGARRIGQNLLKMPSSDHLRSPPRVLGSA